MNRPHLGIAEKHAASVRAVRAPSGEVFRLEWTEEGVLTGHGTSGSRQVVRWAAYSADGEWQGLWTRRYAALREAAS